MFKIKGDFVVIEMEFNTVAFSVCIAAYIELQLRAMVNVDVFVLDVGDSGVEHPHHAHHRIKATIQSVNSKHLHWLDTIFKRIIPCLLLYRPSVKHRTLNYLKFQIFPSNLYRHLRCRSLCGLFEAFVFVHGGHNAAADNGLMHCSRRTDTLYTRIRYTSTQLFVSSSTCRMQEFSKGSELWKSILWAKPEFPRIFSTFMALSI